MKLVFGALLLVLAVPAQAQAPRITPLGDPSVRDDSLYRLTVDPADYPNEDMVLLLDDGVIRYERDGTGTMTYRQVIQLLTDDAAESWTEQSFSWNPERERLRVNWIRVVGLDGKVISPGPSHEQVSDIPAAMENPVYGSQKVRRLSMSGVRAGTIIDFSVTTEEFKPFLPGDFLHGWRITTGRLVRRSRYILDVPSDMPVHVAEHNLTFAPIVREAGGRTTRIWATSDVQPLEPEVFAADSNGVVMHFDVSGATSWSDIGAWYAGLARDRYRVTPKLRARVHTVLADAHTRADTLRLLHRAVAQDIRYVSINLGLGGYQPRSPDDVLATGFGDCKDKATLFIAMLNSLGMKAYPVLLSAGGNVDSTLPSLSAFDHVIAALPDSAGYQYVDLTSDLTPLGELPPSDQGQFGLLVHPEGQVEQVRLPLSEPGQNVHRISIVGSMDTAGVVDVQYEESGEGSAAYGLRQALLTPFDSTQQADFVRALATGIFSGSRGDDFEGFVGKDLTAVPRVRITIRGGRAARVSGQRVIFTSPLGNAGKLADLANQLEEAGPRRFPIDVAQLMGAVTNVAEVRLRLPPGWKAELPPDVQVDGPWGSYHAEYRQEGQELIMRRNVSGRRGIMAPGTVADLIRWLREVARDDTEYVLISR